MSRRKQKHTKTVPANTTFSQTGQALVLPFVQHLAELKKRFIYMALSVIVWSCAAYGVQQKITNFLVRPAHGEHFIYTSPGGGLDFLFRICLYAGLVFSLPVFVFNILRYLEPIFKKVSHGFIAAVCVTSALLALAGMYFGYVFGLPEAIHFLTHQFTTLQIKPLVTIQSYLQFVIVYMVGSAMLFQLPLILVCINRITPLKPSSLFKYERWVILAAFVLAGLMNPSPNLLSQLIIAGPFIVMYQLGILMIAIMNRGAKRQAAVEAAIALASSHADKHEKRLAETAVMPSPKLTVAPVYAATTAPPKQPLRTMEPVRLKKVTPQRPSVIQNATPNISKQSQKGSMDMVHKPAVKPVTVKLAKPVITAKPRPQNTSSRPRQYVDGFVVTNRQLSPWSISF